MNSPILIDIPEELRGEKVLVRPYRPGDGADLNEAIASSRDHLKTWMPFAHDHQTVEESEELVRRFRAKWILREDFAYAYWSLETGELLGSSGLHRIDWDVRKFEIGYWIRASAEGKGYVTDLVRVLCRLAFDTLEANRVFIRCGVENKRSAAVPERVGFELEGVLRNDGKKPDGTLFDMMVWGMTRERWFSLRSP
ncbi:MAG TPA: GNAT family N-acetyltransferase [Fimbriimonas sp.]|nr:GNAT family N-acetyltransferase [Fimbriimonas sp.]